MTIERNFVLNRLHPVCLLALPVALLAGCNSQPSVHAENASVADVAAKAKDAIKIEPGQWSTKINILSLDIPGMKDPAMLKMMQERMKERSSTAVTSCVTPEEAAKPPEKFFAGDASGNCRYEHFDLAGGKLDAAMVCKSPDGKGQMRMEMAGSFGTAAYDVTSNMTTNGSGMPGGGMVMKAHVTGSRTGVCTGKEDVRTK